MAYRRVPLQQALRHQHQAFRAFFEKRARYPRFKSRSTRQSAHYTRSAFTMHGGVPRLAKTAAPLEFAWSWPEMDVAAVARGSPGDACGAGVRHAETPPVRPAVNQEPQPVTAGIPVPRGGE